MVNKRILEYYLESEYFHLAINDLCDDFSGICEKAEEEFLFRTKIIIFIPILTEIMMICNFLLSFGAFFWDLIVMKRL